MTQFRRQFIPVLKWAYFVDSEIEMNAIDNPLQGAIANVNGVGLFQYQNDTWVPIFSTSNCASPLTLYYVWKDDSYSGDSITINDYTFPDPDTLSEENGDFIFELYVNGIRQIYKQTPAEIGEFGIDDDLPGIIFPVALDSERVQFKALIL